MTEHVTLSAFLAPLTAAIKSVAASTWVACEIFSEINDRKGSHLYITVIETDTNGTKIAQLEVRIWAAGKEKLLTRFTTGTGGEKLRKGIRVLLKLRPELHPVFGFSATVEDIDPTFTLGDAAKKLIAIRNRLIEEGSHDRQRTRFPRWPLQTPPLMATQTPPGRTVEIVM
jgi:exodeoxyribonuclease VII large subunit